MPAPRPPCSPGPCVPSDKSSGIYCSAGSARELATAVEEEGTAFLDWLASVCGTRLRELTGWTKLEAYAQQGRDEALGVLDANANRLKIDPRSRTHRARISAELDASSARVAEHATQLERLEREVDDQLADAYGLTTAQRARVDSEYRR